MNNARFRDKARQINNHIKSPAGNFHLTDSSGLATLLLNTGSEQLYSRAQYIFNMACQEIYPNLTLPGFTDHGIRHTVAVLKLADGLVLDEQMKNAYLPGSKRPQKIYSPLSEGEIFLLIVSILLHDLGQLYHDYTYSDPVETFAKHGERTKELIIEYAEKFGLSTHERDIIAEICRSHCVHEYWQKLKKVWSIDTVGPCKLHIIMAILRIADLLDLTHSRAPSFILRVKKFPRMSKKHWERHAIISDVVINAKNWTITVYAKPKSIKQNDEISRFNSWLNAEFQNVESYFNEIGLCYTKIRLEVDNSGFSYPVIPTPKANPFIGLPPFSSSNADIFFGRDDEMEKIVTLSSSQRFLILVGESGVGKTSLVNAGIIPILESIGAQVLTHRLSSPIHYQLMVAICEELKLPNDSSLDNLLNELNRLKTKRKDFYLYIDQFEELFTLSFKSDEKDGFLKLILNLLSKAENFKVIITIRNEFLIDLWEIGKADPIIFSRENIYRITKLSPEMAREAITKPLLKFSNLTWDNKLTDKLIADLKDQGPGVYPPYLQLVCQKLVLEKFSEIESFREHAEQYKYLITPELYEKMGGAEKIINDYFQTILDLFTPQEREVVDQVLARMITEFYSRKPILREEVITINNGRINMDRAMQKLINHRVVKRVYFGYELEHDLLAKKLISLLREDVKSSTTIRKVIDYMEENKHRHLTINELRRTAGLSGSQLIRRFKTETGKTPLRYLNKLRVEDARVRLRDTKDSIKGIAAQCGFKTAVHFGSVFKDLNNGLTPSQYRKTIRQLYSKEFAT